MHRQNQGIRIFLAKHCPDPEALAAVFDSEHRLDTLSMNQRLCSADEEAECVWVVEEGLLQVMAGPSVVMRGPGEIVGEMAFLRGAPGAVALRGNDVMAACRTKVWKIDRSTLDGLTGEARALWYETVARALVVKLDEASVQRANQARARDDKVVIHHEQHFYNKPELRSAVNAVAEQQGLELIGSRSPEVAQDAARQRIGKLSGEASELRQAMADRESLIDALRRENASLRAQMAMLEETGMVVRSGTAR